MVKLRQNDETEWEFVRINRNMLPEEWEAQIPLYAAWSKKFQRCRKKVGLLEAEQKAMVTQLACIKAKIDLDVRKRPTKYGIRRPSEEAFKSAVIVQKEFQRQQKKVNDIAVQIVRAKYNEGIAEAACRTIYQRKEELQDLVKLELNGMNIQNLGTDSGKRRSKKS